MYLSTIVALFAVGCWRSVAGVQLLSNPIDKCAATGNSSYFNVTSLPWPFQFTDSRGYSYLVSSPCNASLSCPSFEGTPVVVCQRDHITLDMYYNCGTSDNMFWTTKQGFSYSSSWSILVFGGVNWRMTNLTFVVDPSVPVPFASFVSEDPYLQYNILITGACLNPPYCNTEVPGGLEDSGPEVASELEVDGVEEASDVQDVDVSEPVIAPPGIRGQQ